MATTRTQERSQEARPPSGVLGVPRHRNRCRSDYSDSLLAPNKIGTVFSGDFPCGAGPNGFTVCPDLDGGDPTGELLIVAAQHGAEIPLDDRVNSYQFGFVFDQDGKSGNNYIPIPAFSRDFFRDTDKWYSVEYTPQSGWHLKVTDARGGSFTSVQSSARAIIRDDGMLLAVPLSEFEVANPGFRITSFRHTGDFGLNPPFDYSADYHPVPGQALANSRDR